MCTFKLCDKFINVVSKWKNVKVETALFTVLPLGKEKHPAPDERDKMLCALKKLVHQLPPAHYSTLKYFMAHLKRVSAFSEQNKMVTRSVVISVIIVLLLLLLCIIIVIDNNSNNNSNSCCYYLLFKMTLSMVWLPYYRYCCQ